MNITTVGIDLAKNVFQVCGADESGKILLKKRLSRTDLIPFLTKTLPKGCRIIMEACGGSHYWSRRLEALGHETKLINPRFVKPFVRYQKNDQNDAEGIIIASRVSGMRFVPKRCVEQQDWQCLHRIRSRLVKQRTSLVNQVRGLLQEYGIVVARSVSQLRRRLSEIISDTENELSELGRQIFNELYEELLTLDDKVKDYEQQLKSLYATDERCQKLGALRGVGLLTATAIVASVGDWRAFKNGRHFAAYLGLVPRQNSSGGKERLLGITKHGNAYLRTLLIHGARSVLQVAHRFPEKKEHQWALELESRRNSQKAVVAIAHKQARKIWGILAGKTMPDSEAT